MTDHDHDQDRRSELGPFAGDAVAELDARGAAVRPDFAAMMARARAFADEGEGEERPLAPVIPLVAGLEHDECDEGGEGDEGADLAPFTAALRGELDREVHQRSLAGIPPLPATRRGPRVIAVLGVLAAAAVLLLFVGVDRMARQVDGTVHGVEANAASHGDPQGGSARRLPPAAHDRAVPVVPSVPEDSPEVEAAPEGPPEPLESTALSETDQEAAPVDAPRPRRVESPRKARPGPTETPAPTPEEEAQVLWQRGELAAAEQKFREVLRVADGRRAELAFGDLFALARQMRGADGQAKVWREYLDRFPRGRFAEDARAGLCQRATGEARAACWQEYLEQHPDGAHRAQAEAARGAP